MAVQSALDRNAISNLQTLIRLNVDSADGFKAAADHLKSGRVADAFREMSTERSAQAHELQSLVVMNEEEPREEGSLVAAAHRSWMDLRSAFGGGDVAILQEAERGEDAIKGEYEKVMKMKELGSVAETLRRQYAKVKAGHDRVRDLRDACQASGQKNCGA